MYKNFIFDLYGTLVDIRTNEEKAYLWQKMSEFYSAQKAFYKAGELKQRFRRLTDLAYKEKEEPDLRKVFIQLYEEKGISCSEEQAMLTAIMFRTLSRSRLLLYEGVTDTLKELKKKGRGVYLLSNAQADFTAPELSMLGLDQLFNGIMISSQEGVKKPSTAFFERLLEKFKLDPEECLMVGNDETSDIAGASNCGMDSLYIHSEISPEKPKNSKATYTVMDGDWKKVSELLLKL